MVSASGIGKGQVFTETTVEDEVGAAAGGAAVALSPDKLELFHALYRDHFDFVFRNLRRLGIAPAQVDDALQDVYMVVLRHLDHYREGTHSRAWLFAIVLRVAGGYRRSQRRKDALVERVAAQTEVLAERAQPSPFEHAARAEAARFLRDFLDSLDEPKRNVFILSELEQMSAPEIAEALDVKLNTVYSRLRAARIELGRAVGGGESSAATTADFAQGHDSDE